MLWNMVNIQCFVNFKVEMLNPGENGPGSRNPGIANPTCDALDSKNDLGLIKAGNHWFRSILVPIIKKI